MGPLVETAIGFVAIMLVLSLLVKSLVSLVKSHIDYYTRYFRFEFDLLLRSAFDQSLSELERTVPDLEAIDWQKAGEEFWKKENLEWLFKRIHGRLKTSDEKLKEAIENLQATTTVHLANIKYVFEQRTKNLSIVGAPYWHDLLRNIAQLRRRPGAEQK